MSNTFSLERPIAAKAALAMPPALFTLAASERMVAGEQTSVERWRERFTLVDRARNA